jgi:hypothetical protein
MARKEERRVWGLESHYPIKDQSLDPYLLQFLPPLNSAQLEANFNTWVFRDIQDINHNILSLSPQKIIFKMPLVVPGVPKHCSKVRVSSETQVKLNCESCKKKI